MIKNLLITGIAACVGGILLAGVSAQPCANTPLKPVLVEFSSRTGAATLVGYDEFTNVSLPPRKYRRLVTRSESPFLVCGPMNAACDGPTCPPSASFSFSGKIAGQDFTFTAQGSFVLQGVAGGIATYKAIGLSAFREAWDQNDQRQQLAVRINGDLAGSDFSATNNQTIQLPAGRTGPVTLQIHYVSWTTVAQACFTTGPASIPLQADAWDAVGQYSATTGALQVTNNSHRRVGTGPVCAVPSGSPMAIPCARPGDCYGGGAAVSVSRLLRSTVGLGCVPLGDGRYRNYSGAVSELLEDEDTEEDAEARAPAIAASGLPAAPPAYRLSRQNGFSFDFQTVRYVAKFSITCPGDYDITTHYIATPHDAAAPVQALALKTRRFFSAGMHAVEGEVPIAEKDMDYTVVRIEATLACEEQPPGAGDFDLGSINGTIALGAAGGGLPAGTLHVRANTLGPDLYTPESLVIAVPENAGFETIKVSNRLRQIRAPRVFVDVVTIDPSHYELRFHLPDEVGPIDPQTKAHLLAGVPFVTYRIDNPDAAAGGSSRWRVTEIRAGTARETLFAYDAQRKEWSRVVAAGLGREVETSVVAGAVTTRTRVITDAAGAVVSKVARAFQAFPWGEELIREVSDPDGAALTSTYSFYDDAPVGDPHFRRLKQQTNADGSWERFTYAADGNVRRTIRPFLNASPDTTDESLCRVSERLAETIPDADGDGKAETRIATVETTLGLETARRYRIEWSRRVVIDGEACVRTSDLVCIAPGAPWDAPGNLVTETFTVEAGRFAGRTWAVINPDRTATFLRMTEDEAGRLSRTVESGARNPAGDAIIDGRRTVTVMDAGGQAMSETVSDIATGLTLAGWVRTEADAFGRPTRIDYDDGTFSTRTYACCGLAAERDRAGITTTYEYDALGRPIRMTRFGITQVTDYDAAGRVLTLTRIGQDGTEMVSESSVYDVAGRLVESRDALGRLTRHAEERDVAGGIVRTTTNPDGGTVVETLARDGSRLTVGGTAAAPRRYEYEVESASTTSKDIAVGQDESGAETNSEWTRTRVDFAGRLAQIVFGDGASSQIHYNLLGQPVRQVDPDGVTTLLSYDAGGRRTITAVDMNQNGEIDFAGTDRIVRETSLVTTREGRVVTRTSTDVWTAIGADSPSTIAVSEQSVDGRQSWETLRGLVTRTEITTDAGGDRSETVTTPDGVQTVRTYRGDRLTATSVKTAAGDPISALAYSYDAHGRLQSTTDARNGETTFTYHADDQIETVTSADPDPAKAGAGYDPQVTRHGYDAAGRLQSTTDPDGGVSHTTYWPTGQIRQVWGTRTFPTDYSYDAQGRLKTLTTWQDFERDLGRAVTTWEYDGSRGFLRRKQYADGTGLAYTYTRAGRTLTRTSARVPAVVTTYTYGHGGDLENTDYSDATPDVGFTYDRLGRVQTADDAAGARVFAYGDESGQVERETYEGGLLAGAILARHYDGLQRLSSVTLGRGGAAITSANYL